MTCFFARYNWVLSVWLLLIFAGISVLPAARAVEPDDRRPWLFHKLEKRLTEEGFDAGQMKALFAKKAVRFEEKIVASYFMHRESKLNYKQFTEPGTIAKARAYQEKHDAALEKIEDAYGVDKSVIVAILLVETRLGTYVGGNSIFNTLATMASMDSHVNRDVLWRENLNTLKISRKAYDKKALRKAKWAYKELISFLTFARKEHIDPMAVMGSYAGAMGICQFMPSNALTLGVDGDNDGSVDLFTHPDAIASVANYLRRYGWKPGIDRDRKYKAVYRYNHSKYYVNIILEISDLLKEG